MRIPGSVASILGLGASVALAQASEIKLNPGYHFPDVEGFHQGATHDAITRAKTAGSLQTLPTWTSGFSIKDKNYSYTMLGSDPALGAATTVIPTVLVPIRLTVPDYKVNGAPLVLDATQSMPSVINSPIFTPARFDSGKLQFADAMLHAEFPKAPQGWHLYFSPSVAPTLDIVAPTGSVKVYQSKSGKYLGVVEQGNVLYKPMVQELHHKYGYDTYVVFVSYNSLFAGAFGFHSAVMGNNGTSATVFAYNSWLVGVNDLFTLPSPNADTFAHETAETVHDPLSTSITLEWGDWFNNNKCFQKYIEVGDAVEDAPAKVQNYKQKTTVNGRQLVYTLQTEAMLPWFERQYPSTAIHGAYSFPGETALLGPAPYTCVRKK